MFQLSLRTETRASILDLDLLVNIAVLSSPLARGHDITPVPDARVFDRTEVDVAKAAKGLSWKRRNCGRFCRRQPCVAPSDAD
jgi:hypothetical protein